MLLGRKQKNPIKIVDKGVIEWKYTTCGYCSTGCSIEVGLNGDGKAVASRGAAAADVNRGKLCLKGIFEHELFYSANRGRVPLVRNRYHEPFQETGWDAALDKTASEIQRIQGIYGRDAFAIVSTGQIMTEEFYTLGKLARGVLGTNNYDGNTTLCMSSAVSGYKRSFGSDGPPGCYDDFEHTECLLAIGSNLPEQHPIIFWRLREALEKRKFPVIVVDPRVTMFAQMADMHLPVTPGTGLVLEGVGLVFHARAMQRQSSEGAASHYEQGTTFGKTYWLRNGLLAAGALTVPGLAFSDASGWAGLAGWIVAALLVYFASIIGRALFYVLVIPTTMPGAFFWRNRGFQEHARETGLADMPQVGVVPGAH